ncbi:signal recognition particle receptor subunit beta [Diachasmimorpha longicaudata]|uniref:signal recognition particle receptor subunit beta n=1 Tax=Diachasmimorpha longicaudata TaxID=58733 RepID=UPI0030B8ABAD
MEKRAAPLLEENISQLFGIIVAIFAIVLTIVVFIVWRRKKTIGRNVLITGLCDAGKTLLFTSLIHEIHFPTYTSVKENIVDIPVNRMLLKIIDIPGNEKLRYRIFDQYKSSARGLAFVIDSVTFQKDIRDVAEFLYTLLCDSIVHKSFPVLVLCTKQDQALAKSCTVIKNLLEKEMNLVRVTKSSQLEATDASSRNTFLGKRGKDFEFDDVSERIEFGECSSFHKTPGVPAENGQFWDWLKRIV